MERARMIVDKFMTIFPASFALVCSVRFCYCSRALELEPRCLVDMPYHNFLNEIFFYDFWAKPVNAVLRVSAEPRAPNRVKLRKAATSCGEAISCFRCTFFSRFLLFSPDTLALSRFHSTHFKSTFSFNSFYICHTCESWVCMCLLALLHIFCHSFE